MRKKFLAFGFLIASLCVMTGCVKISTYTHERVDLETKGNKGYLVGDIPQSASSLEKSDRKTLQFDITLPCVEKEDNVCDGSQKPQEQSSICPATKEENTSTVLKPQQPEPEKSEFIDETIK